VGMAVRIRGDRETRHPLDVVEACANGGNVALSVLGFSHSGPRGERQRCCPFSEPLADRLSSFDEWQC